MIRKLFLSALACVFAATLPIYGQDSAALLQRMKAMEDRIASLEAEVKTLRGQPAAPIEAVVAAPPVTEAPALGGAGGAASKVLNPDIAVIGDFVGAAGNGAGRGTPSLEMHESEVAFQAILDPYARADFFVSFGEHGVDLEEGFLTFPALKGGFLLKVGKMRGAFGKVNTLHNHVLPWADRPLLSMNLIGGEDGIDDAGLSLSRIIPAPGGLFVEATAQLFRGDSEGLFHAWERNDLNSVGHLRVYRDITESTNLDFGASYTRGHSDLGPGILNQIYGLDATLRWKPLRRAIYHSFVGRAEFAKSRISGGGLTAISNPSGYYVAGDYQFARRWFLGGRFDRSDRITQLPGSLFFSPFRVNDTGGSAILTYWPSEFSQIRAQLRRTEYGEFAARSLVANELLFQFQFSIGAHGAHPF